jgi:ABC-type Fe3+ transport system permease subunit
VWKKPRGRTVLSIHARNACSRNRLRNLFIVFSKINLVNTLPGLILADMTFTVPFALIMLSAYMKELPYELVEAMVTGGSISAHSFPSSCPSRFPDSSRRNF